MSPLVGFLGADPVHVAGGAPQGRGRDGGVGELGGELVFEAGLGVVGEPGGVLGRLESLPNLGEDLGVGAVPRF